MAEGWLLCRRVRRVSTERSICHAAAQGYLPKGRSHSWVVCGTDTLSSITLGLFVGRDGKTNVKA